MPLTFACPATSTVSLQNSGDPLVPVTNDVTLCGAGSRLTSSTAVPLAISVSGSRKVNPTLITRVGSAAGDAGPASNALPVASVNATTTPRLFTPNGSPA